MSGRARHVARRGRPRNALRVPPSPFVLIAAANAFVGFDVGAPRIGGAPRATRAAVPLFPGIASPERAALEHVRRGAQLVGRRVDVTEVTASSVPTWDAALIHHVGYWSHMGGVPLRSSWPLPPCANAGELAEFAGHRDMLDEEPLVGDLYLGWNADLGWFTRAAIVVNVGARARPFGGDDATRCEVIGGRLDGPTGRVRVIREWIECSPLDRFVRWSEPLHASRYDARQDDVRCAAS